MHAVEENNEKVLYREKVGNTCEQHHSEGHDSYKPQSKMLALSA